jgi:hypothetical protein
VQTRDAREELNMSAIDVKQSRCTLDDVLEDGIELWLLRVPESLDFNQLVGQRLHVAAMPGTKETIHLRHRERDKRDDKRNDKRRHSKSEKSESESEKNEQNEQYDVVVAHEAEYKSVANLFPDAQANAFVLGKPFVHGINIVADVAIPEGSIVPIQRIPRQPSDLRVRFFMPGYTQPHSTHTKSTRAGALNDTSNRQSKSKSESERKSERKSEKSDKRKSKKSEKRERKDKVLKRKSDEAQPSKRQRTKE